MRLTYPHKHIMSEGCCDTHQWCGLGFCHDDRVNLFQGISHPNIQQYGTSMVGWLCLDHSSGVVGGIGSSIQSIVRFTLFWSIDY